ncbi:MAG TPA: potassium transporter Kup [Treponemataceae bacterium]|nr:potassium transporter Kup [Treponemataceae bacterium]
MQDQNRKGKDITLMIAAIGIVFGDIGTSPLYALRESFLLGSGSRIDASSVIGIVSLLIWTLTLIVCVKYLGIVLRADNKGEGGILALVSLISRYVPKNHVKRAGFIGVLGIVGAALLYSDGMLTPAVSVLSAIEGLTVVTPNLSRFVIPIALVVLVALFPFQCRGTTKMGRVFGPVLSFWFIVIAFLGLRAIIQHPGILAALNPLEAVSFIAQNGRKSLEVMGTIFLAMTGAEVLYSDLGHFGRTPIRRSWFFLVYPALLLNYAGQGAFLLDHPKEVENLFYRLAPEWAVLPLVVLATAATIIASQAVITGAFSLARQSVQLGLWPRIQVKHTSDETIGQVYVPIINWFLMIGTIGLVLAFKTSGNLSHAYGIAVSATMIITTCLMLFLARKAAHASWFLVIPFAVVFLVIDGTFFVANCLKVFSGGWVVIALALGMFLLMKTWVDGRRLFGKKMEKFRISPALFIPGLTAHPPLRVPGTAIFLSGDPKGMPKALLHNLKHNKVLHDTTILLSVVTTDEPRVDEAMRFTFEPYGIGIWQATAFFGFSETPDLAKALDHLSIPGFENDPMKITYFLGRDTIALNPALRGMSHWRKLLFVFMFNNAVSPTDFFRIPPDRVVEIGGKMEL